MDEVVGGSGGGEEVLWEEGCSCNGCGSLKESSAIGHVGSLVCGQCREAIGAGMVRHLVEAGLGKWIIPMPLTSHEAEIASPQHQQCV